MPLKIDPAWEYFQPDPELEELTERRVRLVLVVTDYRLESKGGNIGFRFGKGNPNYSCNIHLARAKRSHVKDTPELVPIECPVCSVEFKPRYVRQRFCSRECSPRRPKEIPRLRTCECGIEFKPTCAANVYCSRRCGSKYGLEKWHELRGQSPEGERVMAEFKARYERGEKMSTISSEMGVAICTLRRWRKKMDLVSRPSGAPRSR